MPTVVVPHQSDVTIAKPGEIPKPFSFYLVIFLFVAGTICVVSGLVTYKPDNYRYEGGSSDKYLRVWYQEIKLKIKS